LSAAAVAEDPNAAASRVTCLATATAEDEEMRLRIDGQVLLISNEVGMSVVPPRTFRDIAGRVNQRVAGEAEEVYFLVAGIARQLK